MVEPLHADLLAGTLPHGLFHIVAGLIAEQTVDPAHRAGPWAGLRNWGWRLKVQLSSQLESLAVTMPPVTTLPRRRGPAGRCAGHRGGILSSKGGDGGAHPVALLRLGAELVGPAEGRGPGRRCAATCPSRRPGFQLRPVRGAGVSWEPRAEFSTQPPGVIKTRSCSIRSICSSPVSNCKVRRRASF